MEEYRPGIGAGSSKKKVRGKALQEQRRQRQGNTEKGKEREQEETIRVDFGDGSTIELDWSLIYGMVCKVINQRGRICWSRSLTCLLEAAFNKDKDPKETYLFSHEEFVKALKSDASTKLEVSSLNNAVKHIQKKGLVKINSAGSWDEDGYRAKWKFEVKQNVTCQFVKEQVILSPVGIVIEVDSEFLNGTGRDFYRVRAIGRGAERHALIIIGYGRTKDGQFFFICQNSWGKKWGFNGIARLIIDDTCPILIFYPTGDQLFS